MISKFLQNTLTIGQSLLGNNKQIQINKQQYLPNNLGGKILNLQIDCQTQNGTSQLIAELMSLYTQAIQFYQSIGSDKYLLYRKRMQHFLSKKSVQNLLKGQAINLVVKKQNVERSRNHALYSTKEEVNRLIQKSLKKQQKAKEIIDKQVKNQQKLLEERISRRRNLSNKSIKTDNDSQDGGQRQIMSTNLILGDIRQRNLKKVFI